MTQMIIVYLICGATWGFVFSIIGSQEGRFISNEVIKFPSHLRKTMLIGMVVFCTIFEALTWPVDTPIMLYKMFIKKSI